MGTNYYGKPIKAIKELKQQEINLFSYTSPLRNNNSDIGRKLTNALEEHFQTKLNKLQDVHIGKSSAGWRFLFDHNNLELKTIGEFKEWLTQFEIVSEYNQSMSQEEFWQMVEGKQSISPAKLRDNGKNFQYYKYLGDYEFSTSTDFS